MKHTYKALIGEYKYDKDTEKIHWGDVGKWIELGTYKSQKKAFKAAQEALVEIAQHYNWEAKEFPGMCTSKGQYERSTN